MEKSRSEGAPALLVLEGRDAGRIIPLRKFPFTIGRLLESDLVLADEQVSREHARIEMTAQGLEIRDVDSRNGIFINDRKESKHILGVGDRVRLGMTVLVYHPDSAGARNIMAESIPDSPAFAFQNFLNPEESTSVRFVGDLKKPADPAFFERSVAQAVRLFRTQLPPKEVASQIVDLFFQTLAPDRVQVDWQWERPIQLTRTRKEGKAATPFEMPADLRRGLGKPHRGEMASTAVSLPGDGGRRKGLASPLVSEGALRGWIIVDRSPDQGAFLGTEVNQFEILGSLVGAALERSTILARHRQLEQRISLMERHLPAEARNELRAGGIDIEESDLKVENREVTILFTDIQGFTPLSESLSPEELAMLLNEYFQRMNDVIEAHRGSVNKYIGDAVMALFGAVDTTGSPAVDAVGAGFEMIHALKRFWEEIDERKRFNIRVGINTGDVVVGRMGAQRRMEFTVLGDPVNVASRLEGISPPNVVTIGARTAELVKGSFRLEEVPKVKVKGKSGEISVFRVLGPV